MSHGPETIRLVGNLDQTAINELIGHCQRLAATGRRCLVIDMTGVAGCDHDGLVGLGKLTVAGNSLRAQVVGAHWSQFVPALCAVGYRELDAERSDIRELIHSAGARSPARTDSVVTSSVGPGYRAGSSAIERPDMTPADQPDRHPRAMPSPRVGELQALVDDLEVLTHAVGELQRGLRVERPEVSPDIRPGPTRR